MTTATKTPSENAAHLVAYIERHGQLASYDAERDVILARETGIDANGQHYTNWVTLPPEQSAVDAWLGY